jgi:hypothetical protein
MLALLLPEVNWICVLLVLSLTVIEERVPPEGYARSRQYKLEERVHG